MSAAPCRAVVTGGGTAGHVLPALAIAEGLVAAGVPAEQIHYVGTTAGRERQLVPPTGYAATYLDVVGLQRSLSRRNLAVLPKAIAATLAARRLIRRLRPSVVVNVGGYGSFPATLAARLAGVPIVVVSYDQRPGLVSRLFARRAALVAVAVGGSPLPKATVTGAPVRQAVLDVQRSTDRPASRELLELPTDRFVVVVACGSHGSQVVNAAVEGLVGHWATRRDVAVVHLVGDRNLAAAAAQRGESDGILYRVLGFSNDMPALYAAADVMVTRAGAGTMAEVAAVGVPAIVIPWAGAAENHQVANARVLADQQAAVLVEEAELTAERLAAELSALIEDRAALRRLGERAYAAGSAHRSGALARAILEVGQP